ncbi:hypothetical protein K661_03096 [Piscirickettsia salmonis LF-89 = ATCC VR-1361]|nr:hypothetical protein K661_03096 [Piscirickettsia salmonis LF-89 = ATCC VR-1361]
MLAYYNILMTNIPAISLEKQQIKIKKITLAKKYSVIVNTKS